MSESECVVGSSLWVYDTQVDTNIGPESADQFGVVMHFQPNMNNLAVQPAHREAMRLLSFRHNQQPPLCASGLSRRAERNASWDVKTLDYLGSITHPSYILLSVTACLMALSPLGTTAAF